MYFSLLNWALVLFLGNYYPVVSHVKTNPGVSQYAALFSFDFIFLQPILAFEFVGYCLIGSFIMPSVDLIMCYSIITTTRLKTNDIQVNMHNLVCKFVIG